MGSKNLEDGWVGLSPRQFRLKLEGIERGMDAKGDVAVPITACAELLFSCMSSRKATFHEQCVKSVIVRLRLG